MNALVRGSLLFCIGAATVFGARVKNDGIKTNIIQLPKVSLETVDYNGLAVSYAISDIEVVGTAKLSEETPCMNRLTNKAVLVNTEYLSVEYKRPALAIVVKDKSGAVIYAEKVISQGTSKTNFGKGECSYASPGAVDKAFTDQKAAFLKNLQTEEMKELKENVKEIIANTLFAGYAQEEFKLYYVDDKEGKYKDLEEAYTLAGGVYKICALKTGYLQEQVEPLKKAITIWEKSLTESNLSDKNARINHEITLKIYENIAVAQLFLGDYESALTIFTKIKSLENLPSNRIAPRISPWFALVPSTV